MFTSFPKISIIGTEEISLFVDWRVAMPSHYFMKPCNKVGCAALVRPPERYCVAHKRGAVRTEQDNQKYYDKHQRDKKAREFYKSREWRTLRQQVLARDKHLCVICVQHKRIVIANAVDHIVPISKDWSRRLDPNNCRSLCAACHNKVRAEQV